jgi:hypothetical protein
MSFDDYLKNRSSQFEQLQQSLQKNTEKKSYDDDRIWKPRMGKDGTGYAVVRFLPGKDSNKTPWVTMYDHGFQGPTGKWYIENSLTTIGKQDPVSEHNSKLWNSGIEENKEIARKQKRRTAYYANALILNDPNDTTNEGKVKIYKFGQKIFDKIMSAMQPEFDDDQPVNPFDLLEGANFRIKIKMVGGYWNYDSSTFEKSSALSESEEKMKAIFDAQHDVHDLVAEDKFKSYDELKEKLTLTLGESMETTAPAVATKTAEVPTAETSETKSDDFAQVFDSKDNTTKDDDEDLEDYFKTLAADA